MGKKTTANDNSFDTLDLDSLESEILGGEPARLAA